ncbi:two-component system, chemotaxis family, CheB/CheR fusion protein [Palleronia salina]|uniref:Two-component system, chemotaxis family, CheB/CheR fusion protein n=1 Tax=Palleronia salina TaxID=313368 RepID=A0A1M6K2D8_9RHOB|nr:chemotaxis protein CheB [Palleronia salina]SHJ53085.1 two-component system, chemotaxis family, CheB/CheR fusion protein [Palleronia salina]
MIDDRPRYDQHNLPVVGIGASAGGLEALREMFSAFREPADMAFVVVQHLDPTHESLMAQLIERYTDMAVSQAAGGEVLEANHIYVIPPGHGLAIEQGVLKLTEFVDPRGMRRPIDDFLESLAHDKRGNSACVILSGTGADGSRGMRAIMEQGGLCLVQEPSTARYDGMPTSAIRTGLVDVVSEPDGIIEHLSRFFDRTEMQTTARSAKIDSPDYIDALCDRLRETVGHDFSSYKRPTLVRRVARRMQVLGIDDGMEYLRFTQSNLEECNLLFRDLLINVTRFFRDTEHFEKLNAEVIEPLVANACNGEEIRLWVPGCSSGEEAFTYAIYFIEAIRKHDVRPYVQIFATDIDDKMLDLGRACTFPLSALTDIPAEFRDKYTIVNQDNFSLIPQVRDMVRFSLHSLIKDPPFSKIDLVSCRNLLIYLNEEIQAQVVPLFHFALRKDAYLFLGSSEAIGRFEDLFETIDQSARIFRRKSVRSHYSLQLARGSTRDGERRAATPYRERSRPREDATESAALRRLAEAYAPVSMLIDDQGNLLQKWGRVGRYLDFPDRVERYVHVPSLARPGLREVLGAMLRESRTEARRVTLPKVEIATEFGKIPCSVAAEPIEMTATLLVIRETGALEPFEGDEMTEVDPQDGQLRYLEEELQSARHRLSSTVEELETTNEELKSSNEEMMSMNEELQSTNEELTTVNDELKNKVDELTVANADLKNFFGSTELVVMVVDRDLRLRSYTDPAEDLFNLSKHSVGKSLSDIPSKLTDQEYLDMASAAAGRNESGEYRSQTEDRTFVARVVPYRRLDGETDGATLIFTDVTNILMLERNLKEQQERLGLALDVAGIGVWEYEPKSDAITLDETERTLLDLSQDTNQDSMDAILEKLPEEDRNRVNSALRRAMDGDRDFDEVFRIELRDGGTRWLHGMGRRVPAGSERKFIGVTYDVSPERELLAQRELLIREMHHRVKNLFAVVSSLISVSARDVKDVESFAATLRGRLQALDRSHSLSTGLDEVNEFALRDVIDAVLSPVLDDHSIQIDGTDVLIGRERLTPLALIFHEWITNSMKYGALAVDGGTLRIDWTDADGKIDLNWVEDGVADDVPDGSGFGTRLVSATAHQLSGEVEAERLGSGYRRRLVFSAMDGDD